MTLVRNYLIGAVCGASLAMSYGCKAEGSQEQQPGSYSYSEQGLGDAGRLTKAEWTEYMADQRYLHSLAKPGVSVHLNLADPKQYRFAMTRLKLAGKTPENSPYLFESMERHRQTHLARGYQAGLLAQEDMGLMSTADRQKMHFIEVANVGETTPAANDGIGTAGSTNPGGSDYLFADAHYSTSSGAPLGNGQWTEQYGGGHNVTITATGNLGLTTSRSYVFDSYETEASGDEIETTYVYTTLGTAGGVTIAEVPRLSNPSVQAPLDVAFNDNLISVCMNRTWTADCDYELMSTPQAIKLPLQGSVSILSNHVFDEATINTIKQNLNANLDAGDVGSLKLVLANVGGGCDVTDGNTLTAKMGQFWNRVTLSPNKKTFSWDLTNDNSAFFDDGCRQVQDSVKLTARLVLPLVAADGTLTKYRSSVTLSNDPTVRADYTIKRMTMVNSCLAAGTEIEMAGGKPAPIESLKAGDHVINPYQPSLTVMDTAVGFETVPMVRIRSEAGRSLLMTEMHPMPVVSRGMVQAKALKKGDVVMTRTGPSKLVEVSREAYSGKVYNLKVGSDVEQTALGEDQTVVYANGFMVGDGQIQKKYETKALTEKAGDVLARLPSQWHRDYLMSTRGK